MAIETELKLSVAPRQLGKLKEHPLLASLSIAPAKTQKLYSVYYDTPKQILRKHAMALRLRRVGKQWLQTLKGGGGVQAGLHRRNEWEMPVQGEALDFAALKAAGGKLPRGVRKKLQPAFVTEFTRHVYLLHYEGAEIELALDRGAIRAGNKKRPISELELELKSGEPQQLFRLALALSESMPLEVENTSKAEYGYRLFSGEPPAVFKTVLPALEQAQGIAAALQGMIAACLLQMQANIPGAIQKLDEEYLHQVRVGLRRLRVALALAAAYKPDAELQALRHELKILNNEFGRLREWDVFVTQTLPDIRAAHPGHSGLARLLKVSEQQRALHHAEVAQRLTAPEFQRLLLRIGAWLHGDYWRTAGKAEGVHLADFAQEMLRIRQDAVEAHGKKISEADAAQLHTLRIACKKLRYSAEMFALPHAEAKNKRVIASLVRLQETLGKLNDFAVARRQLDEMKEVASQAALKLAQGWLTQRHAELLVRLNKVWQKFEGRKWRVAQ